MLTEEETDYLIEKVEELTQKLEQLQQLQEQQEQQEQPIFSPGENKDPSQ